MCWPKLHRSLSHAAVPCFIAQTILVLGAPFYVMERVRGVILRSNLPHGLDTAA